jgi:hypothetical protein
MYSSVTYCYRKRTSTFSLVHAQNGGTDRLYEVLRDAVRARVALLASIRVTLAHEENVSRGHGAIKGKSNTQRTIVVSVSARFSHSI